MTRLLLDATPDELRVFMAETDELLQSLEVQLVRLEQGASSPELLQEVFRAAHTIKGSAAAIGHVRMAQLTHAMETLLDKLRYGELLAGKDLLDALFSGLDVLRSLAAEVERGEIADLDVESCIEALEKLASSRPAPSADASIRPTTLAPPPGSTHHLLVEFESGAWAAVRALQMLLALDQAAEVLISRPDRSALEANIALQRLEAWLLTDQTEDELRAVIAEVPEVTVLSLLPAAVVPLAVQGSGAGGSENRALAGTATGKGARAATVRIEVSRLDKLLDLVGELLTDRARLLELERVLGERVDDYRLLGELAETTQHLGRVSDALQAEVMQARMLPIATVFSRLPRVVRDLATSQGKQVELDVSGEKTELDRTVIEEIGDPLIHLLRNAVDHGVELPAEREAAGKPVVATVRLRAQHVENYIVVEVQDDGRGVDVERLRARAVEHGILAPEAAERLSDQEALELMFAPGISTASRVTDVSGRGVGLDIVRTNVERLGGTVDVQSTSGQGSTFVLRLPLTLAILRSLLVRVAGQTYALPLGSVTESLRVPETEIRRLHRQDAMLLRGKILPILRLRALLAADEPVDLPGPNVLVVAVQVGDRPVGLVVDALLGEQEVVIKPLGSLFRQARWVSGAAILGDGTVAPIVDISSLVDELSAAAAAPAGAA
jgi:two-component system chemotaxis sensor kinase CheA